MTSSSFKPDLRGLPVTYRILALGDSYTVGESVSRPERWPTRLHLGLIGALPKMRPNWIKVDFIAKTGWTTAELVHGIQRVDPSGPFDLVTLLIGVNNQYRGLPLGEYRDEFRELLSTAIRLAEGNPQHVIVLSIPDWGVTPFADGRDRAQIASDIDAFNAVNREEAMNAGARYVDITPISRHAATENGLLAEDGLHPSGKMYREWAELVLPEALAALAG